MASIDDKTRERSPDRRRNRGGVFGKGRVGGGGGGGPGRRAPPERRIFVSNVPFEMKWQEVKDMFREHVGDVTYVELFNDENEKPRGCGILEFATEELAQKAVEKMHRYEYKGRKLVVKEDFDNERDKHGRITKGNSGRDRGDRDNRGDRSRSDRGSSVGVGGGGAYGNTFGLSPQFLESLGIDGPLHTRLFVANLSYTVDEKKLREVFRLAGRVVTAELNRDKEGKSRGHAVVEYDHPVEAVQAISMFNNQSLYERKLTVRFDKQPGPTQEELSQLPSRLPDGLGGVGMGLGSGGNPLTDVAKNLPSANTSNNSNVAGTSTMGNMNELTNMAMAAMARQMSMNLGDGASNSMGNLAALAAANMGGSGGGMGNMGGSGMGGMGSSVSGMGGGSMGSMGGGGMGGGGMGGMGEVGMGRGGMGGGGMGGGGMGGGGMGGGGMGGGGMGGGMELGNMGRGNMGGGMGAALGDLGRGSSGGGGYSTSGSVSGGYGLSGASSVGRVDLNDSGMSRAPPTGVHNSDTIIIRNLPMDCNWQVLREGFSHCGEIKYAEMKERGTGLIRFNNERDAERAMSMMNKQTIAGRTIDVRLY